MLRPAPPAGPVCPPQAVALLHSTRLQGSSQRLPAKPGRCTAEERHQRRISIPVEVSHVVEASTRLCGLQLLGKVWPDDSYVLNIQTSLDAGPQAQVAAAAVQQPLAPSAFHIHLSCFVPKQAQCTEPYLHALCSTLARKLSLVRSSASNAVFPPQRRSTTSVASCSTVGTRCTCRQGRLSHASP